MSGKRIMPIGTINAKEVKTVLYNLKVWNMMYTDFNQRIAKLPFSPYILWLYDFVCHTLALNINKCSWLMYLSYLLSFVCVAEEIYELFKVISQDLVKEERMAGLISRRIWRWPSLWVCVRIQHSPIWHISDVLRL